MAESVGRFVKVSRREGPALYVNPHYVTAVEAGSECIVRLHDGSTITVAETAEELVRILELHLPAGRPPTGRRLRLRERRRQPRA